MNQENDRSDAGCFILALVVVIGLLLNGVVDTLGSAWRASVNERQIQAAYERGYDAGRKGGTTQEAVK